VQPITSQQTNSQLGARAALVRAVRRAHIGRGYDALLLRVAVWEFARAARHSGVRLDRMLIALSGAIEAGMLGGRGDASRATMLDRATWWATEAYVEGRAPGLRDVWSVSPHLLAS
jgi:hypothetical protein